MTPGITNVSPLFLNPLFRPKQSRVSISFQATMLVALLASLNWGCQEKRPNILLVSLDACRADHLSAYGYERATSPFLSELADEGMLFVNGYVNTHGTTQSHTTILSSQYQESHRVMWNVLGGEKLIEVVPQSVTMIQQILNRNGYVSLAVTDGGFVAENFGLSRGFAEYHEASGVEQGTDHLLDLLRVYLPQDRPIFAFYHTYQIHSPYSPPVEYKNIFGRFESDFIPTSENLLAIGGRASVLTDRDIEAVKSLYDGEIRYTDDILRRFFGQLQDIGFLDNYLLIVTADHGEEFGEHGGLLHRELLYDELIRAPFILSGSDLPKISREERMVSSVDIVPTILDYAGVTSDVPLAGASLLKPAITNPDEEAIFSQYSNLLYAVRTRKWKLIQNARDEAVELYDMERDPRELTNRAAAFPDQTQRLLSLLKDWKEKVNRHDVSDQSLQLQRKLKSLGYVH